MVLTERSGRHSAAPVARSNRWIDAGSIASGNGFQMSITSRADIETWTIELLSSLTTIPSRVSVTPGASIRAVTN